MKRWSCYLFICMCALFLLLAPVYAQKITGTISGTVTDPTGAVVANATVTITLFLGALCTFIAIFLILEMNTPLDGMVTVSMSPMHEALAVIGH